MKRAFPAMPCILTLFLGPVATGIAQPNLVVNGDFEGGFSSVQNPDPLDGSPWDDIPWGWTRFETFEGGVESSAYTQLAQNGPSVPGTSAIAFARPDGGASGDWTAIRQDLDIDARDCSVLTLNLDVRVTSHNLEAGGWVSPSWEWPVTVQIDYRTTGGGTQVWRHGWYVDPPGDGTADDPGTGLIPTFADEQVSAGSWDANSFDLLTVLPDLETITRITVGGSGWSFEAAADNVGIWCTPPDTQVVSDIGHLDPVPAATLLLPYFEVTLGEPPTVTTLFTINNAKDTPALAHVLFWTDWSAPTLTFDVFLTGYDVVAVNIYDIFRGIIPITADAQSDPMDTISPHGGPYSDNPTWDGSFPGCAAFFAGLRNPVLTGLPLDDLINSHTGQPLASLGSACGVPECCRGADHGDAVPTARGYVTIDSVSACSMVRNPGEDGYFIDGGLGIANNSNQLWGDYFIVDFSNAYAIGEALVHINADDAFNAGMGGAGSVPANPTNYTFYGRYTQAANGADNREPLGSTWAIRFLNGGAFSGGTDLLVWRDSTANHLLPIGVACGEKPDWSSLRMTQVIAFNEQEDAIEICNPEDQYIATPYPADCFPYETGRYRVGSWDIDVPYEFGWLYLNLNLPADSPIGDVDFPAAAQGNIAQSYVTAVHSASGLFSLGLPAIELSNALEDLSPELEIDLR